MNDLVSVTAMAENDSRISEIVAAEGSRLRAFIRRRVPDTSDVEDILQEVFYRLVEANRLLMPIEHVTGWLFRVARNRITDLFRKREPESLGDAIESEDGEMLRLEDLLPSPDAGPDALYVRHVLLEEIEYALAELPEEQREVVVLRHVAGWSPGEIAEHLGKSEDSIHGLHHRGRRALQQELVARDAAPVAIPA